MAKDHAALPETIKAELYTNPSCTTKHCAKPDGTPAACGNGAGWVVGTVPCDQCGVFSSHNQHYGVRPLCQASDSKVTFSPTASPTTEYSIQTYLAKMIGRCCPTNTMPATENECQHAARVLNKNYSNCQGDWSEPLGWENMPKCALATNPNPGIRTARFEQVCFNPTGTVENTITRENSRGDWKAVCRTGGTVETGGPVSCNDDDGSGSDDGMETKWILVSVFGSLSIVGVAAIFIWCCCCRKKRPSLKSAEIELPLNDNTSKA